MNLMYLLLFILCFKESNSNIDSYNDDSSRIKFLCGCQSDGNDMDIEINCDIGDVIKLEPSDYKMRDNDAEDTDCGDFNYDRCQEEFKPDILKKEDSFEVYKKCSLRNSCYIKIAGVNPGRQRQVNYPFFCYNDESVMDSTTPTIPTTTVVNSTPEGPAPTDSTCTNQSNDVGNVYVITLGVILAAVILLTIVGIAIYCVLR
ncbi:hypothetical protein LOTGIDRAFT_171997 [Lottia gigantea]|uniref:SUEL-type lectin domain-containing protein n=1 Tax=Lottia gigantea TaxID=225164 RepID=V4BA09_LOTGI|nr:hypothetical protein LOTGIDRAFT_171997 [Lottia gigantea]ESP02527.1 hypothetical protein LOTGIDRAFT_171997 [Lottia gigantea]